MRTRPRVSARLSANAFALAGLGLLAAAPAGAGTSIDILVPGQPTITINDGDAVDNNGNPMEIEYDFSVSHPLGNWTAVGTVIAKGGGLIPATTVVTDVLIQKHFGVLLNDEIKVIHYFVSNLTAQPYEAKLDSQYDNLLVANIGVADLLYVPSVNAEIIGVIDPPIAVDVPGPTPQFFGSSGPLYPAQQPMSQTVQLLFYLDIPGDAIRMFNSATIQPVAPSLPSLGESGLLVAASVLVMLGLIALGRSPRFRSV